MGVRNTDTVRDELQTAHATFGSWRKVAAQKPWFPIPAGTLCTFAKDGYLPRKWSYHLGLPAYEPAPVCLTCGQVHVTKRCTNKPHIYRDLFSMPPELLRYQIENREEIR